MEVNYSLPVHAVAEWKMLVIGNLYLFVCLGPCTLEVIISGTSADNEHAPFANGYPHLIIYKYMLYVNLQTDLIII